MTNSRHALWTGLIAVVAACSSAAWLGARQQSTLSGATPPNGGIWLDSLDVSKIAMRPAGRGGGGRAGAAPTTPPPPPTYVLGGVTYAHTIPVTSDTDFTIDLKGAATRFEAMVGIDDAASAGRGDQPPVSRGSAVFGVWVDGKKVADSGVMKGLDQPKRLVADLKGAKRLTLAVNDANDGTGSDNANWAGALIMTPDGTQTRPEILAPVVEPAPPIASSRTSAPQLNSPKITGATPGRPFMFMIPASGDEPLTFAATNLPEGLSLDAKTGLITGALKNAGRTDVDVTVTNAKGKTTGKITIVGGDHMLALTPPLGWNSWNAWGNTVTADKVRLSAEGMVKSGLARHGYTYINIDDVWEGGNEPNPATGRGRNVAAGRDAKGEILTNANFADVKGLVDYIHGLGLKAGIYSSPGPTTCQGLVATYQHELQDVRTWAKWGFDYIKYDWCSYSSIAPTPTLEQRKTPYRVLRAALNDIDRDMIYSLCQYGAGNVWEWGNDPDIRGNLWRMTGDIRDSWASMAGIGFQQTGREKYAGPGHWNDTDMLVVGMVGWSQGSRPTNLTPNEQLTHIALWALQAAPMLIGADLSKIDEWTTNVLGNREVLAVNQDVLGKPAGRLSSDGWVDVWARPLEDGSMAVGLFNRSPEPAAMSVKFSELGLSGSQRVRDLWQQKDLGASRDQFSATVPRHGVVLVKIGK
ncbi:MAG TPA: NPCBM/NEW2 domain-containing protein [Vicinamibacterales bacterium]|nr:NPCBM/NEW2 domain-containing protein [Vicinamibacterales bacterium]